MQNQKHMQFPLFFPIFIINGVLVHEKNLSEDKLAAEVEKEPASINTAVHSLIVTPVVNLPQDKVIV